MKTKQEIISLVVLITFVSICITVLALIVDSAYEEHSMLFSFGPSTDLYFLGIAISTWSRYTLLAMSLALFDFLSVLQDEYLEPYSIMIHNPTEQNREDLSKYSWVEIYTIVYIPHFAKGLRHIVSILLITTQIPLAIMLLFIKEAVRGIFLTSIIKDWSSEEPKRRRRNI